MPNGQQLVVGSGDGGVVPAEAYNQDMKQSGTAQDYYAGGQSQSGVNAPGYGIEGYGSHANQPPSYLSGSQLGNPAGSALQGQQYPREKQTYNR